MEVINRTTAQKLNKVRMVGKATNEIVHILEALEMAEADGLDLVLVSAEVQPPVVRIQDFKKIEYERKKARKVHKPSVLKEIQFKVNISDHDLQTKIEKIKSLLDQGDKVKISVRLKGRERENPERAESLVDRVGKGVVCKFSKVPGPIPSAILEPIKVIVKK